VSASTDETDKVVLLELGADDYVTKPFSSTELLARVRAAIRRAQKGSSATFDRIHFGEACVDFIKMQASVSGSSVHLTAYEFRMLNFLFIMWIVLFIDPRYSPRFFGTEESNRTRTMDNVILRLRQKLERDPANPVHILTVRGLGYQFVP